MKKFLSLMLAALLSLTSLTACGSDVPSAEATPTPEPTPTPRMYFPNPFTGEEKTVNFKDGQRPVAIMVNNIAQCRPQSGLSQAQILFETKVEGGITRFMAIFEDYTTLDDVGPVRSGRDQFLRLIMPWEMLYMHIGRSEITQTYIDTEYNGKNYRGFDVDGAYKNFIYRRNRPGKDYEHTAYTNGELLQEVIEKYEIDMKKYYDEPIFDFVDYDLVPGGKRELPGDSALDISIVHSEGYRTYFTYDEASDRYMMSQYNSYLGKREDTIDENNGVQLGFENVIVLMADISPYPYPGGNPKGDPNYQNLFMDWGWYGYYFSGGKSQRVHWGKGGPTDPLVILDDETDEIIELNCGKTYIAFIDEEEIPRFEYVGNGEEISDQEVDMSQVTDQEIGEE